MELGEPRTVEPVSEVDTGVAVGVAVPETPAWERLETQIAWYDKKSNRERTWFKRLKVLQVLTAAPIPVAAAGEVDPAFPGGAGALIVVVEGLQQQEASTRSGDAG